MARLHVVGVRHHSPACARVVAAVLERARPQVVLVEGPADYNPQMAQLALAHTPPVAVFTHYLTPDGPVACFTPFCEWSPEWIALRWGFAHGATVRFADLPAWDKAFAGVHNRYRDRYERYDRIVEALCRRSGCADLDSMWDHLFEGREPAELTPALAAYFEEVRGGEAADERDAPREAAMRAWAAWALTVAAAAGGDVVFVCGGWHAPALADVSASDGGDEPAVAAPPLGGESHLVPWSHARMDSFAGYEAGMPSPAWWAAQWRRGPEGAAEELLGQTLLALRSDTGLFRPTVADHIAARTQIAGLAALRGHPTPQRVDVLDGLLSALMREPMSGPPPWARRGLVDGELHPILATMLRTFTGSERGALADETARPPLLRDVLAQLEAHELVLPRQPRLLSLDWRLPADRPRLRLLHRLRLLQIPGAERVSGPARGTDAKMAEAWRLAWRVDFEPAVIEASQWGSTLDAAVGFMLSQRLLQARSLTDLVAALHAAGLVGLAQLAGELVQRVAAAIGAAVALSELAGAMRGLLELWRHGEWLEMVEAPLLAPVLAAAAQRALTLAAGIQGDELLPADLDAMSALRDVLRHAAALGLSAEDARAALLRRRADAGAPAMLRGAALGAVWSLDGEGGEATVEAAIADATAAASQLRLGEYLAGLFALARSPALRDGALIGAVDAALAALGDGAFLTALPALRLAFSWFPPRERQRIGELLAARWGRTPAAGWLDAVPVDVLAAGVELDARVTARGRALGVLR